MTNASAEERRNRARQVIEELMKEREQTLVAFCSLAGLEPYANNRPALEELKRFMQVMVDYIALGHFEVYQRITEGEERRARVIKAADSHYEELSNASAECIGFNDKYEGVDDAEDLANLSDDLSTLGEYLAIRIEMEDMVIASLVTR